jgi:hypothetical protein
MIYILGDNSYWWRSGWIVIGKPRNMRNYSRLVSTSVQENVTAA